MRHMWVFGSWIRGHMKYTGRVSKICIWDSFAQNLLKALDITTGFCSYNHNLAAPTNGLQVSEASKQETHTLATERIPPSFPQISLYFHKVFISLQAFLCQETSDCFFYAKRRENPSAAIKTQIQ
jgi:hypothetical protein